MLSSRYLRNSALASISISENTTSTEKSLSTQAFTWRFTKLGKYLPISSTTNDKWRIIRSVNESFSFLASSTIVSFGNVETSSTPAKVKW